MTSIWKHTHVFLTSDALCYDYVFGYATRNWMLDGFSLLVSILQGADATLKPPQARSHNAVIVRNVADTVLEFAEALNNNSLHDSSLPRFVPDASDVVPPAADTATDAATTNGKAEFGSVTAELGATQQGDNPDQVMSVAEQQGPGPEQPIQETEPAPNSDIEKQTHEAQPQLSPYERHSYEPVTFS